MKFVIHPPLDALRVDALRVAVAGASWVNANSLDDALSHVVDSDAFLGKITPSLLAAASKLRWVQSFTASLEHYMFPALVSHACVLTNMRGLFGDVIADQVLGYILCFARNLHTYARNQLKHLYEPVGGNDARVDNATGPGLVNAMDLGTIFLPGSTLGVVGCGGIGCEVARRAGAFGMKARGVDREPGRLAGCEVFERVDGLDSLADLLAWSDFVVIAAPHTPETERLFNASLLAKMRPTSYLINVGRGAIVVLDDLVDALRARRLAGAALDVFEVEPLPSDSALWDMPNVIITPHTAGYSTAIAGRHFELLRENVKRFVNNEPLLNVVTKPLWF
jgi:phosphoglycerate dehydrogenase-like enzyme